MQDRVCTRFNRLQILYKMMLGIIGSTLAPFDLDCAIPLYGYGDFVSLDKSLVAFDPQYMPFSSASDALAAYDAVIRKVHLSGPANFVPAIYQAMQLVDTSGGRMHTLVILACSSCAPEHEQASTHAVMAASACALHIVVVALGDGPWHRCAASLCRQIRSRVATGSD